MTEQVWEYECNLIFNSQKVVKFTLTDHWQINHPEISQELIVKLVQKLNGREVELTNYQGSRKVFRWRTGYQGKLYRLIFWFKDGTANHLWVRNRYPLS